MKHTIKNITSYTVLADRTVFQGQGGQLVLGLYEQGAIRVSYRFEGKTEDAQMRGASDFITQGSRFIPWMGSVSDTESYYRIELPGDMTLRVEKANGVLSLFDGDKLLHGGRIGSEDLVIPEYPVRLISNGEQYLTRFNFPLKVGDEFFGLGDKSGYPDRRGRRFSMFNRDSLGYDASNSDPLYKSVPFFIKVNRAEDSFLGVLFPLAGMRVIDFGKESPFYYMAEADGGPCDYCLFTGNHYADIVALYCRLTGLPALGPLYSFGFLGSSMNYLEPQDAAKRVLEYFERTEKEGIPCEGMYFSSGYLKAADGKRYAFIWNEEKFPNYGTFMQALADRGYYIIMNLKPGILCSHPWYPSLDELGYFIKDQHGKTYIEYFWGGAASFVDFANPDAKEWWKKQIRLSYLDHGCAGIWNDNNELELEDSELLIYKTRSQYPALMSQASWEAIKEHKPELRPWIYSRAGSCGLQRYARTWTGDNASNFTALRYNQYMGLSLGLSGMPFYGHDLGGFYGDFPQEELLLRSCETAIFQPRFVIHSWRENGVPTEPWSYPSALERIKRMILCHYFYMPYIYDCAFKAALTGYPMERMLRLEFPYDTALSSRDVNMLFGPYVLKVQAVEPALSSVPVYLPAACAWYDPREGKAYRGGQTIDKFVPIDGQPHIMIRLGAAIPTAPRLCKLSTALFEQVDVQLYPCLPQEETFFDHYEDDGCTELSLGRYDQFRFEIGNGHVVVTRVKRGAHKAKDMRTHRLLLPDGFIFTQNRKSEYFYDPQGLEPDVPLKLFIQGEWDLK